MSGWPRRWKRLRRIPEDLRTFHLQRI